MSPTMVRCHCGTGACMLCDDRGFRPIDVNPERAYNGDAMDTPDTFTVKIGLGNDAMRRPSHVARALRALADTIDGRKLAVDDGIVRDGNGNTVGRWALEVSDPDVRDATAAESAAASVITRSLELVEVDANARAIRVDGGVWVSAWVMVADETTP